MKKTECVSFICIALATVCFGMSANARSVFLPDWQEADLRTDGKDFSRDENWCQTAVKTGTQTLIYHKAKVCPAPKTHDDWCEHDPENWITECYCPSHFNQSCVSPFKGDERKKEQHFTRDYKTKKSIPTGRYYASCDGKYVACCDTRCPQGTLNHPGSGYCYSTTANGCGETCYYNVRSDSCRSGYNDRSTGDCGDSYTNDCGRTCYRYEACPPPPPPPAEESGSSSGSGGGNGGSGSGSGSSGSGSGSGSGSATWSGQLRRYWNNNWMCWSGAWNDADWKARNPEWCGYNLSHFQIVQSAKLECCKDGKAGGDCFIACNNKEGYGRDGTCYATQAECEAVRKTLAKNPNWGSFGTPCDKSTACGIW